MLGRPSARTGGVAVNRPVFVISNDLVPGLGLPVAAPGLRAAGLADGLRRNGIEATVIYPSNLTEQHGAIDLPPPAIDDTIGLDVGAIKEFLTANSPCTAIITNSNMVDVVPDTPDVSLIVDFFAPKMLESQYSNDADASVASADVLRRRKLEAIRRADALLCNGPRKVPYYLGWTLAAGRLPGELPIEVVWMPVRIWPGVLQGNHSGPLRVVIAGYRQGWSGAGDRLRGVADLVDTKQIELGILMPSHWAGSPSSGPVGELDRLVEMEGTTILDPDTFSSFQYQMSGFDVALDAFEWNLERQYAVVTRTVVSLASGLAVVHPDFTEVGPLIEKYEAGWTYADRDGPVANLVAGIAADAEEVMRRRRAALRLANDVFDPRRATAPIVKLLERRSSRSWSAR